MRRVLPALLLTLAALASAAEGASLAEAWQRVQHVLAEPTPELLDDRIREMQVAATEVDARRLTPYAVALVTWAESHPGDAGRVAVRRAMELDPLLPAPFFLEARWRWNGGSQAGAVMSYLGGAVRLVWFEDSRRVLLRSAALWLALSLGVGLTAFICLQVARHAKVLVHDVHELGRAHFGFGNALVMTFVVLLLPLFAGLGPLWLVAYLFAATWIYMPRGQRALGVAVCVVMALLIPLLEGWRSVALQPVSLAERAARMLDDRVVDPGTLREFVALEGELGTHVEYHLLLAEMLRLHGDSHGARVHFQKASLVESTDPRPYVALGSLAVEDGDLGRAIQEYNAALAFNPDEILAHLNLSFTFDQSYRFQEADRARARARELGGRDAESLGVRGRGPRIRFPRIGSSTVDELVQSIPAATRLAVGLGRTQPQVARWFLQPTTLVFVIALGAGLVGLALRSTRGSKAVACARCGKVFCPRCSTADPGGTYCAQCTSVFLRRDLVSIEQQAAKLEQIRRWEWRRLVVNRLIAALLPGGSMVLGGSAATGLAVGLGAWTFLLGGLVWCPRFLPSAESLASPLPLQVILVSMSVIFWTYSISTAWSRR